jgi:hypothetical protein
MRSQTPAQLDAAEPGETRFAGAYPVLWAAFLTVLVSGPWLKAGYLFGTDWPGPRRFDWPTDLSSAAPLQALLAVASGLASGEATGKLLIVVIFFVSALTSYVGVPSANFFARAAASTLYAVNPFVYGRLHYGQIFLLGGYAVLPWFCLLLRRLLEKFEWSVALLAAFALSIIGIFTPHIFLIAGLIAGVLVIAYAVAARPRTLFLRRAIPAVLVMGAATFVASAFWIVPLLFGRGAQGVVIGAAGRAQITAFAARPDTQLGLIPNLLGLYGFWAEDIGRFISMKAFVPGWPIALLALLLIGAVGVIDVLRRRSPALVPWVAGLLVAAAVGVVLEAGVSLPQTAGLVTWLDAHFALYRGMRDAGKWAVLLALVYSQLVGLGVAAILDWARQAFRTRISADWVGGGAAALLLALPLYYGNGLLFGAHGGIEPSSYPAGWYQADRLLAADDRGERALFLPWHEYMSYSFIRNQNKVVASPAPAFFSIEILASQDPEVPAIAPPTNADQVAVRTLVNQGARGRWAEMLAAMHVKYVLLAKEFDWQSYAYLDSQANLSKVADFGSILVFRNQLVI